MVVVPAADTSATYNLYWLVGALVTAFVLLTPTNLVWAVLIVVLLRLLLVAERIERHLHARRVDGP